MEQVILGKQNRFGRSSEKMDDTSQISFREVDGTIVFFNEAEAVCDLSASEPENLELKSSKQPKRKGKKRIFPGLQLNGLTIISLTWNWKQDSASMAGNSYRMPFPKNIISYLAKVEVEEHHVGVYASKTDEHMVKADHPKASLHGSLVSLSLAAAIINGKYVNAVPLYRLEQEFQRYGLQVTRQTMANWCIRLGEKYLSVLYDYLHKELYSYHVIQADETPVLVNHDGRKAGSKSWMWVYRSGHLYQNQQIVLYEYQQTRNASHPREFLKGYDGVCVTDGYQVYHTLEKELEELTIAGCWVHCRRRFDEALKLIPKSCQKESEAFLLMKQIQAIYREEGKLNDISPDERLKQRQAVIKPLVDAFFAYLKTIKASRKDKFGDAVGYALNQERYLRVFLTDGDVPIDNNASERAIRGFCIGKKNWQMIDTINGAKTSAIIYSIVETAKANHLKPFDYVQHLLEEIPKHMDDRDCSFLEDLLPWSEKLPAEIRKA